MLVVFEAQELRVGYQVGTHLRKFAMCLLLVGFESL